MHQFRKELSLIQYSFNAPLPVYLILVQNFEYHHFHFRHFLYKPDRSETTLADDLFEDEVLLVDFVYANDELTENGLVVPNAWPEYVWVKYVRFDGCSF